MIIIHDGKISTAGAFYMGMGCPLETLKLIPGFHADEVELPRPLPVEDLCEVMPVA